MEPKPRHVGEQVDSEVAVRKLRYVVKMAQRLVPSVRVRMMVRVTFEVEQYQVAENMIAVPGVMWLASFVPTLFVLLAQ